MADQEKRKIDELFGQHDVRIRNWILESLKEDPKLYDYLASPAKESEDDPVLKDKHLAESISNIRRFVQKLWPKKKRRRRMVQVETGWFKTKDEEEISRDKVRLMGNKNDSFYKILKLGRR